MYQKEIKYDRETKDYAMYLDGELVGFARTYLEAELTLDQLVFELLSHNITPPAQVEVPVGESGEFASLNFPQSQKPAA